MVLRDPHRSDNCHGMGVDVECDCRISITRWWNCKIGRTSHWFCYCLFRWNRWVNIYRSSKFYLVLISISFPSLHCSRHWLQLHRNVRDYGPRHHQKLCPLHYVPDLPINHDRGLFCSRIRSRDKSARGNVADEYVPPSLLPYTYNTNHCATKQNG